MAVREKASEREEEREKRERVSGIKALLSAAAAKPPRPQLAAIQLSGCAKRKRGGKSLTSHMVPSSVGDTPRSVGKWQTHISHQHS